MVLDHVAHRPDRVIEAAAVVDPEVLGDRHLHVGDVLRFQTGSSTELAKRR